MGDDYDEEEEEKKDSSSSEGEEEEKETGPMAAFGPDSGQEAAAGEETVQHPELLEGSATEAKTAAFESDKMGDSIQMEERESDNEDECTNEEEEKCEQKKENVQGKIDQDESSEDEKENEEEESPDGKMDQLSFGIEVQSEMPVAESDVKVNEENLTVEDVNASNKFEGNNSDNASEKDDYDEEEEEKKDSSSSEGEEEEKETGPMAAFGPDSGQEAAAGEETVQHPELLEGSATEAKTAAFESD